MNDRFGAVLLAGGDSTRMGGGRSKVLAPLGGQPALLRPLRVLCSCRYVKKLCLVCREQEMDELARLVREAGPLGGRTIRFALAGRDRQDSVWNGVQALGDECGYVLIHDGARPFVTVRVIEDAVAQAARSGAAAPAVPVKDTIKEVRDGLVERTLDRSALYAVQTPQVFDGDLIRAALQKALDDAARLTDDCAAVERLGMKVVLTRGDERNIKLTTPADLLIGEVLAEEAAP